MSTLRRSKFLLLSLAAAVLAACGGSSAGGGADATPGSASAVLPQDAGGDKLLGVASWNLYLGAEVVPLLQATSADELLHASTAAWAMVIKNDFHVRARALAAQIALAEPELIGLQEAYTWSYGATPVTMQVVYDYVESLREELAALGLHYRVAAEVALTDLDAQVLASVDPPVLAYVRGTDHEVILAREDVETMKPEAHVFPEGHLLHVSVLGQPLTVKRGWVSVLAKQRRAPWVRFASTHLEAYDPAYRALQAADLAAALAGTPRPVVLVGDLNSDPLDADVPDRLAYLTLIGAGFEDAWLAVHLGEPGFTDPFPEDLTDGTISLNERIDFILFRNALQPIEMTVLGAEQSSRVCGVNLVGATVCLWPSDHAGVSATLRLETPPSVLLAR